MRLSRKFLLGVLSSFVVFYVATAGFSVAHALARLDYLVLRANFLYLNGKRSLRVLPGFHNNYITSTQAAGT